MDSKLIKSLSEALRLCADANATIEDEQREDSKDFFDKVNNHVSD